MDQQRGWRPGRGPWFALVLIIVPIVSWACCGITGASLKLLPFDRWGFGPPRELLIVAYGPEGASIKPLATVSTVGCLQIWTPAR